jgi:NaMN:DMB phosphoribosyltransferase
VINSVLALGFDSTKFSWSEISPITIEHKKFGKESIDEVNKSIDAGISVLGIYLGHDIVAAASLIGAYLTIDAASLLGKSSAGADDQWVKDVASLRDQLRTTRTLKAEASEILKTTFGEDGIFALNALHVATERKTRIILVGPGAIALGFVANRGNSSIKDYLLIANTPVIPALNEAIKHLSSPVIMNSKENTYPLAELALAVSALKVSEL